MIGDLHCHSKLSDSSMGLESLLFYAKRMGLDFIAVTDHDTLAGTTRAAVIGKRVGIGVIPGVEMSCVDNARGKKVHMLCYLPQKPDRLEGMLGKVIASRTKAGQKMVEKVMRYFPVTMDHIAKYYAPSKSIYKQHIMNALFDLGYCDGIYGPLYDELFNSKHGLCYEKVEYPDVFETLDLIHQSGGCAVLAHPRVYDSFDLLDELAEKGLIDGVEASHPKNKPGDYERIMEVAEQYHLITTGGTDFHGMYNSRPNPLGTCVTSQESLERLFAFGENK
ncbi:PHP domain-containing protein [Zongyangia hominis]|uniref:PHP domain-containing protein n=1 Tax=Zongyangia hominis TaxID=2763677 RepID=A0A926EB21_9FIRM|nr:PHP domain-containing protein [Zongyangia hominis]MBC8569740.1 PHP domain-containing protein [Zongyangia hominis]